MQRYDDNLSTPGASGGLLPLSGVSVTITDKVTGLPVTVYANDGVTVLAQPLVTDNNGGFGFRAPDGTYVLTFSGSRIVTFTREIVLDDPSENPYATRADLASLSGATLIGYQRPFDGALMTVSQAIDAATASNSATILGTVLAGLSTATNAVITTADTILSALGKLQKQITDWMAKKDASDGYAGLTLFKINFKNAANTFTSFLTNTNTAARTYTFPDKDITVAGLGDIPAASPMVLLNTATVSSAVASINFLTAFSSTYDAYRIEVESLTLSASAAINLRVAQSGAAVTTSSYIALGPTSGNASLSTTPNASYGLESSTVDGVTATIEIRNANEAANHTKPKAIGARGVSYGATLASGAAGFHGIFSEGLVTVSGALSGFQIFPASGNFTAGTVRVFGIKNT
jgi:hypothetical protein